MIPQPGKTYTIQDENSLSQVAARAYGDATLWTRIWEANQNTLQSGNPDLIFPGETILIPILPERKLPTISAANKDPDGIYIDLGGREIRPLSCNIIRTMDTIANSAIAVIPWEAGLDTDLDTKVQPKSYTPTKVSIGGEKIIDGILYTSASSIANGATLKLFIDTPTADLVDSDVKPPLEFNGQTLHDIIKKQVEPLGFTVRVLTDVDISEPFDTATAQQGEPIFRFLSRLSKQRGVLLSCDIESNVTIISADVKGAPIATLEEGVTPGVMGWGIAVNGRNMFNSYRAIGLSPLGNKEAIAQDNKVPRSRRKTTRGDQSTTGNIQTVADWARNKTNADALTFPLTVEGWYDPQGELWKENTIATIISKTMFLPKGFNFLINQVEYILDSNGQSTRLSFVPPTVYTQGEIVEPW